MSEDDATEALRLLMLCAHDQQERAEQAEPDDYLMFRVHKGREHAYLHAARIISDLLERKS